MAVITIRIPLPLKRKLQEMVKRGGYRSLSELLNEAILRYVEGRGVKWKDRREVREYFSRKKRLLRGLEEVHEEEDL